MESCGNQHTLEVPKDEIPKQTVGKPVLCGTAAVDMYDPAGEDINEAPAATGGAKV